jgi:DNA polymerase-4
MIILHVDMNSYFATVEQQTNPFLRGKPICVAGKGSGDPSRRRQAEAERTVCCAASIEAKKFGIKSGCGVWRAKTLCPGIIIVPADYDKYQFLSQKIFTILENFTPLIEIFSIDEAFLDLSHLGSIQKAIAAANDIKKRIREEAGDYLKCSIGIAANKLLAKLASEMKKPDGLTIIDERNIDEILATTPIEDLCGIGSRLKHRLNLLGIYKIKELAEYPHKDLVRLFGPHQADILRQMGQGQDFSKVLSYHKMASEKSFGHSYTLPKNIFATKDAQKVLLKLAEKVGRRMRKAGFLGRTIEVYLRFFDFSGIGGRVTLIYPVNDGYLIYQLAQKILQKFELKKPIRALGVRVGNLKPEKEMSFCLLSEDKRRKKTLIAMDKINDRFGEFTVFRGVLTNIHKKIQSIPDGRNKRLMDVES